MAQQPSIFAEEWRACLIAHYKQVVDAGDKVTEKSLHGILLEANFSEDQIKQMYVEATMHVTDYIPEDPL